MGAQDRPLIGLAEGRPGPSRLQRPLTKALVIQASSMSLLRRGSPLLARETIPRVPSTW